MQTEHNELFGVTVSDSSRIYIRKFAGIVKLIIVFVLITHVLRLTQVIIHAVKIDPSIYSNDKALLFEHNLMPFYTAISFALVCITMYIYWQLSRHLAKGINDDDVPTFNRSFQLLYRYAVYGLIGSVFSLLFHFLDFYITLERHVY